MMHILFICTGNTCRSPMCAALVNGSIACGMDLTASSAGLYTHREPISPNAVLALAKEGIPATEDNPYPSHVSHTVTEEDIKKATWVVGVTPAHAAELIARFPEYRDKIIVLPTGISDPYGGDANEYGNCLRQIKKSIQALLQSLNLSTQ